MEIASDLWVRIKVTTLNTNSEVLMLTPSTQIIQLLSTFAVTMTAPTFANALVLIYGAILAPGRRTVASALRVMGRSEEANPSKFHRVLSRARWSTRQCIPLL